MQFGTIVQIFKRSLTNSIGQSGSRIRNNFAPECEKAINEQINWELHASYTYTQMAFHFNRDDVALQGFEKFFHEQSEDERKHANLLMSFLNRRGGKIVLKEVQAPTKQDWPNPMAALDAALALEQKLNGNLIELHNLASTHSDAHLSDFIEGHFLNEQVDAIYKLSRLITNLQRVGGSGCLGEFQFDVHAFEKNAK